MDILQDLISMGEKEYADFQYKLTPTIEREKFIGIRVPVLRAYAKKIKGTKEAEEFIKVLPHRYYDENMLHALLLSEYKDIDGCLAELDRFLPFVDNWAVCDIMSPKILRKDKTKLLNKINEWTASEKTYTFRFGVEMLMSFYLDDDFKKEYLEIPLKVNLEDYYAKMMVAWFYATALAKQYKDTVPYIENKILPVWTHNKTIQKAIESYRITDEQKEYLKALKIK